MEQAVNEPITATANSLRWHLVGLVMPQVRAQRLWLGTTRALVADLVRSHSHYWKCDASICKIGENRGIYTGVCERKHRGTYVLLCQQLRLWHFLQHMGRFLPTCSWRLDNEGSLWRRRWPGMSCLLCDLSEAGLEATVYSRFIG